MIGPKDGPPVRYADIRERNLPGSVPPIWKTPWVARESFAVTGVGGIVVLAGIELQPALAEQARVLMWVLPVWILGYLVAALLVGRVGGRRLRVELRLFRIGAVSTAAAIVLASMLTGGLGSPVIVALFLVTVFEGFVMPSRDTFFTVGLSIIGWTMVAAFGPPAALDLAVLQIPLFGLAWAIGEIAHRAYSEATTEAMRLSTTDPVTGCLNRLGIDRMLEVNLRTRRRRGGEVAVLMLDLDDFKRVNDTLGHHRGDEMLSWVGEQLRLSLRSGSEVGRLGGDEFVAVLPATGATEAERVAGRVAVRLAERVGASVGWASTDQDGDLGADLLRRADARLYGAKERRKAAAEAPQRVK